MQIMSEKSFILMCLIRNKEDITAFTGICCLHATIKVVQMCEPESSAKRFTNTVEERVLLCITKLRLNLSFRCFAVLFGLTLRSCAKNVI